MIIINVGKNPTSIEIAGSRHQFAPSVAGWCPDHVAEEQLKRDDIEIYDPSKHASFSKQIYVQLPGNPNLTLASAHALYRLLETYPTCNFDISGPAWVKPLLPGRCRLIEYRQPGTQYYRSFSGHESNNAYFYSSVSMQVNPWPYLVMCTMGIAELSDRPGMDTTYRTWKVPHKFDQGRIFIGNNAEVAAPEGYDPYTFEDDFTKDPNAMERVIAFLTDSNEVIGLGESIYTYIAICIGKPTAVYVDAEKNGNRARQIGCYDNAMAFKFGSEPNWDGVYEWFKSVRPFGKLLEQLKDVPAPKMLHKVIHTSGYAQTLDDNAPSPGILEIGEAAEREAKERLHKPSRRTRRGRRSE